MLHARTPARHQANSPLRDARGSRHLRAIWTDDKKIPARDLPELLQGVQLLSLATVTAKGELTDEEYL